MEEDGVMDRLSGYFLIIGSKKYLCFDMFFYRDSHHRIMEPI